MHPFEEKIKETKDSEDLQQKAEDDKLASSIREGEQEVYIEGVGTVVFKFPGVKLSLEGDQVYAEFISKNLRSGKLLTKDQLKAIYGMPVTVEIEGKEIVIGEGSWTDKMEQDLENLPDEIRKITDNFNIVREEVQQKREQLDTLSKNSKKKRKELEQRIVVDLSQAKDLYEQINVLNLELLELQTTQLSLFSTCLEEQANMKKIQLYAPSCVSLKKEDGTIEPLWKDEESFLSDSGVALRIISLFSLFLRGASVSFFADKLEEAKT